MKTTNRTSSVRTTLAACLTFCTLAAGAAEYRVEHNFRLRPGGNQVPVIRGKYYCHAWTTETRPDCSDWDVNPNAAAQPLGWGPFGSDSQSGTKGPVRNTGNGGGRVEAQTAQFDIPATGFWDLKWATADDCDAYADANSEWSVNATGAGGDVTGTITAWGEATAAGRPHRSSKAYAFSMTSIEAQGSTLRKGKLKWHSVVRDTVRGGARSQKDPVDYTVTDLVTGASHRGTLLSISMDMLAKSRDGGIAWASNRVEISASDMNFNIELPGRFTSLTGRLDLQIRGGVVASSTASGIYAGNIPPVGTPVPLAFDLANDIEFDYDLGSLTPAGNDVDVEIEMYGSGEAQDEKNSDEGSLTITPLRDSTLSLSWPVTPDATFTLQSTKAVTSGRWDPVDIEPQQIQGVNYVKVAAEGKAGFFRLVRDPVPPCQILIHQQPQDVTVEQGQPATFFVEATGLPAPGKFQWQRQDRNGEWQDILGASEPVLLFDPGSEPFDGWPWPRFRCVIDNGCASVTSAEAVLAVKPGGDRIPPMVQMVFAECPAPILAVMFSEPVRPELAMQPQNYQLQFGALNGPRVVGAQLVAPQRVQLFLSAPVPPEGGLLNVRNIQDLAGNVIPDGNSIPVNCGGAVSVRQ